MTTENSVKEIVSNAGSENVICLSNNNEHYWSERDKFKWMVTFFFGNMILYSGRYVMSICLPAISKELSWNKEVSGMALSSFFLGYLLTNMLGGYLADRVGGEIVIWYTGIGWASLTIMLPFLAHSQFLLHSGTAAVIVSRFLIGLCQGVFYPSMSAIMSKHVSVAEKGFFSAFTHSGVPIGMTATGLLGSIVLKKFDWSVMFIIVGSLSLLWVFWLRYLISGRNLKYGKKVDTKLKESLSLQKLVSSGPFWGLFITYFTSSYCFHNFISWTPVYFHDTFPHSQNWLFNTIPWLVCFMFSNISGYAANRLIIQGYSVTFVRKLFATIMLLGYSLCCILLISIKSFNLALFIMSINIALNGFSNCSLAVNSQDLAPRHAGVLHGFMNGTGALAGVLGVYVTGYILETNKYWKPVFQTLSGSAFIGAICFLVLGSGEPVT